MHSTDTTFTDRGEAILARLPDFTLAEQRLGLALYRLLAQGRPVTVTALAAALDCAPADVDELLAAEGLRGMVYRNDDGQVIGFGGLAVAPMPHRFEVDGRTLYTWCAWDSLFLPEMLGKPARVTSRCPETGEDIRLTVTPDGVASVSPADVVVSFLVPEALEGDARRTMASFCHFLFFLASPAAGAAWVERHPGTFVLTLDQAFALGKEKNARQFGAAWAAEAG